MELYIRCLYLIKNSKCHLNEDVNCSLLGHYTASSDNVLRTFWNKLSVPSSEVKNRSEGIRLNYFIYYII